MGATATERTSAFRMLADALQADSNNHKQKQKITRSVHGVGANAFGAEAAELMKSLVAMEELLREIRPKYMRPKRFIRVKGAKMSEREKDEFDADFTELVKSCSSRVDALKDGVSLSAGASVALVEHQKEVVTSLLERLKSIANATKRMQKQRYDQPFLLSARLLPEDVRAELPALEDKLPKTRVADATATKKPSTLATTASPVEIPENREAAAAKRADSPAPTPTPTPTLVPTPAPTPVAMNSTLVALPRALPKPKPKPTMQRAPVEADDAALAFTDEQDRRFRAENIMLHRHFLENLEDAKSMETKMAEISHLMGQFADKIMTQQSDIEMIHQHATETKTNVTQSNRILEQTQNIGRGYGFFIFCFYVAFSLLLHALHYFHD